MSKFRALFKFEFMANSLRFKSDGIFSRLRRALLTLVGVGCLVVFFLYAVNIVMEVFINANMLHEFVTIFTFFMMIVHLVSGVTMATKILFVKVDLSLLKLPVSGGEMFLAKFLYLYLKQLMFSLIISFPIFLLFGIKTGQGVTFFFLLMFGVIFLPILPLLFSILLSVPVMWIIKIFKNKFFILLIFYTLVLVAGFTIYIYALKFILGILESGNFADVFDNSTILAIRKFSTYLYVPLLFKNILLFYDFWRSFVICLAVIGLLCALIYVFAQKFYFSMIISSKNQSIFQKKTKVVHQSGTHALLSKEFKNIFRSTNYAFQYLTIVFTTPLMVYFSSEIASNVGTPLLGKGILPGIVVLVLIMFLSMGTSFSATSVTREGGNFFLTKIIPVSFTKQIFVKFVIYLLISIPAIFVSCFILAFAGFVDYVAASLIAVSLSFVITGNICHSILMDIKRPQFQYLENGEVSSNNKNISASIGIGFAISFLMGVGGIVLSFFVSVPAMYMVLFGFGVPFASIETFRLFFRLERRYNAIEV